MYEEILRNQTAHREAVLGAALEKEFGSKILEYETAKAASEFASDEDVQNAIDKVNNKLDNPDEAAADELENAALYNTEAGEDYPETDNTPYHSTANYTMIFDPDSDEDVASTSQS